MLWGWLWDCALYDGLRGSTASYDAALCEVFLLLLSCSLLLGLCMKYAPKGSSVEGLIDAKPVDPIIEKGLHPEGSDFVNRLTSDRINSFKALLRANEVQEKGPDWKNRRVKLVPQTALFDETGIELCKYLNPNACR